MKHSTYCPFCLFFAVTVLSLAKHVCYDLSVYMQADGINSTPAIVIAHGQDKNTYRGAGEIIKAMETLVYYK